ADADTTRHAPNHHADGRHTCVPSRIPAENANAAYNSGWRGEVQVALLSDIGGTVGPRKERMRGAWDPLNASGAAQSRGGTSAGTGPPDAPAQRGIRQPAEPLDLGPALPDRTRHT